MSGSYYLFASDVHLSAHNPSPHMHTFCTFLNEKAVHAETLYLLGDLFDYWTGSSMLKEKALAPVFDALRHVEQSGTAIHLIPGNRDFLLSPREARRIGMNASGQEVIEAELNGIRLFLTHGDLFCTHDLPYQRMKKVLRNPVTLALIRMIPGALRSALARRLRRHSTHAKSQKTRKETSLNKAYVQVVLDKGFSAVICGHVHDEADEVLSGGGRLITLSEWSDTGGSYAELDGETLSLKRF